jgi:hypothetical protein
VSVGESSALKSYLRPCLLGRAHMRIFRIYDKGQEMGGKAVFPGNCVAQK